MERKGEDPLSGAEYDISFSLCHLTAPRPVPYLTSTLPPRLTIKNLLMLTFAWETVSVTRQPLAQEGGRLWDLQEVGQSRPVFGLMTTLASCPLLYDDLCREHTER